MIVYFMKIHVLFIRNNIFMWLHFRTNVQQLLVPLYPHTHARVRAHTHNTTDVDEQIFDGLHKSRLSCRGQFPHLLLYPKVYYFKWQLWRCWSLLL